MMEHLSLLLNRKRCVCTVYYYLFLKQEPICLSIYPSINLSISRNKSKKEVPYDNFLCVSLYFSLKLWWGQERTESVFRLRPSQGWNEFLRLQALSGDHSTLTVFYDGDKELQEVCAGTLTNSK